MPSPIRHSLPALCVVALVLLGGVAGPGVRSATAQGTAQVIVSGLPPVLPTPYISDLERGYRQGLFGMQFIYNAPGRARAFRFRLTIEVAGETRVDVTSEPVLFDAGSYFYRTLDEPPAILFPLSFPEMLEQLDPDAGATGLLPEGDYVLTIEPIAEDESVLLPTLPGIAFFSVQYTEPPLLMTPFDGVVTNSQYPIFSWTPAMGVPTESTISYELLIVEVYPGQTAYQALESNREHVREVLIGQTSFVYRPDLLPLEAGKTYAWQVRAADAMDRLPFIDDGTTEAATFSIGAEGLGSMLTTWSYPVSNPFLAFEIDRGAGDPGDEIYVEGRQPVELLGRTTEATFNEVLIDEETQALIEGTLVLDDPFALEIELNPLNDALVRYRAVPTGSDLHYANGMVLEMGSSVRIDAEGIHPRGTGRAVIAYDGLPESEEWTATYAEGFTLGFAPFGIVNGRVDFASDGVFRAYADPAGFHLIDESDPVLAQVPDRLYLPNESLAYVTLKRDGVPLVDAEEDAGGRLMLTPKPGASLDFILPALQGDLQDQPPRLAATFDRVVVDPVTATLVSGTVRGLVPPGEQGFTLEPVGVPLAPTRIEAGLNAGAPVLHITGHLALFGQALTTSDSITVSVAEDGLLQHRLALDAVDATVRLSQPRGDVSLQVESARGDLYVPLLGDAPPYIGLNITGAYRIETGTDTAIGADIAFHYAGEGPVTLTRFDPTPADSAILDLGDFAIAFRGLSSLELGYRIGPGAQFRSDLDAALVLGGPDDPVLVPLHGATLTEEGLYLPDQDLHAADPRFPQARLHRAGAALDLLAVRVAATTFDWYAWEPGTPPPFAPRLDFGVHFPERRPTLGAAAATPLTLQDATPAGPAFQGTLIPYTYEAALPDVNLGGNLRLQARSIAGTFAREDERQRITLELTGDLDGLPLSDGSACAVPPVTVRMEADGHYQGSTASFTPCTTPPVAIGPATVAFSEAVLRVEGGDHPPRVVLDGRVVPASGSTARIEGTLAVDLTEGRVLSAAGTLTGATWPYPSDAPLFELHIATAEMTNEGLAFPSDSALTATALDGGAPLQVRMDPAFRLAYDPAAPHPGEASISRSTDAPVVVATFGTDGFRLSEARSEASVPARLNLPGTDAYLRLRDPGGRLLVDLGRPVEAGIPVTSTGQAVLVLDGFGADGSSLEIPVPFNGIVDDAFALAEGRIQLDLDTSPLDLGPYGLPAYLTALTYRAGAATPLTVQVQPILPSGVQPGTASGLTAAISRERLVSLPDSGALATTGEGALTLTFDRLEARMTTDPALLLHGRLRHPLFVDAYGAAADLPVQARYEAGAWSYALAPDALPLGTVSVARAVFRPDPLNPPVLTTSGTAFAVSMAGLLTLPSDLGEGIRLSANLAVGSSGVTLTSLGNGRERIPLFGGFLTAVPDTLLLAYDPTGNALAVTMTGGVLEPSGLAPEASPSQQDTSLTLPLTRLRLESDGSIQYGPPSAGQAPDLLAGHAPVPVIDRRFWIEAMRIVQDPDGPVLALTGRASIPLPGFDGLVSAADSAESGGQPPALTDVRIRLNRRGETTGTALSLPIDPDGWTSTPDGSPLEIALGGIATYEITAARLDYDWRYPVRTRLAGAGVVYLQGGTPSGIATNRAPLFADGRPERASVVPLGNPFAVAHRPGFAVDRRGETHYYLTAQTSRDTPLFDFSTPLLDVSVASVTLADTAGLVLEIGGPARLPLQDLDGSFTLTGFRLGAGGLLDPGAVETAATLSFGDVAALELGCFDRFQDAAPGDSLGTGPTDSLSVPHPAVAGLLFGDTCGDQVRLTLADLWVTGPMNQVVYQLDQTDALSLRIEDVSLGLASYAGLEGDLIYNGTDPALRVSGTGFVQEAAFPASGTVGARDGRLSLNVLLAPTDTTVSLLAGMLTLRSAGGGFFYRPDADDLELVRLALDEINNGPFPSTHPDGFPAAADLPFTVLLPAEVGLFGTPGSYDIAGPALFRADDRFTLLDLHGTLLGRTGQLEAGLLLHLDPASRRMPIQGTAALSLNFDTLLGGIVQGHFLATRPDDAPPRWAAYGDAEFLVTDQLTLPGRAQLSPDGLLLEMRGHEAAASGIVAPTGPMTLSIWQTEPSPGLDAYFEFDAALRLLDGFVIGSTHLGGNLIVDRDEPLLFAANNTYVDVPYVHTGRLDVWYALQDGQAYAGDGSNAAFSHMLTESRRVGREVESSATAGADRLLDAVEAQPALLEAPTVLPRLGLLARSDSVLASTGSLLVAEEARDGSETRVPRIFETLAETLYRDPERPAFQSHPNTPALSQEAYEAYQELGTAIEAAQHSAEADRYSLGALDARPIEWDVTLDELPGNLGASPVMNIQWPAGLAERTGGIASFTLNRDLLTAQTNALLAMKQSIDATDIQYLRAVGGLEVSLVNLKIARSPDQATHFAGVLETAGRYQGHYLSDHWRLRDWAAEKRVWLEDQEEAVVDGIETTLATIQEAGGTEALIEATARRRARVVQMASGSGWARTDLPPNTEYRSYLQGLDAAALEAEFRTTSKHLWYDFPTWNLTLLSDSLASLIPAQAREFNARMDSVKARYGAFTRAVEPLYDAQTQWTATLYGMADQYSTWRSMIRHLDPEDVHLVFQFNPYRGNFRMLARDLEPPVLDAITVDPAREAYVGSAEIRWEAQHPVDIAETSISIVPDAPADSLTAPPDPVYLSLATRPYLTVYAPREDTSQTLRSYTVTIRVRGSGGVPSTRTGQFRVAVTPEAQSGMTPPDTQIAPFDETPPPTPLISDLAYSAYFSENPNILSFLIGDLRDAESGIGRIEYQIVNERDPNQIIQPWTLIPSSSRDFKAQLVETSLPALERNTTVQVAVRVTNGAGMQATVNATLPVVLDTTRPEAGIAGLAYVNAFDPAHPNALRIDLATLVDGESGIERVEYVLTEDASANLANVAWQDLIAPPGRVPRLESRTVYLPLPETFRGTSALAVNVRVTNGAGQQTIVREGIELPDEDTTPPTDPIVALDYTGYYHPTDPNRMRITIDGSQDLESGIAGAWYRVLDGSTGIPLRDWTAILSLSSSQPYYVMPAGIDALTLPSFESSRAVLVEAHTTNRAGITSRTAVQFLQIELDVTPPAAPELALAYFDPQHPTYPNALQLDVGPSRDPESGVADVAYRVVDVDNQRLLQDWRPVAFAPDLRGRFPGRILRIDSLSFPETVEPEVQVRVTNGAGLQTTTSGQVTVAVDDSPPTAPVLALYDTGVVDGQTVLELDLGPSEDPQSGIREVVYQIRDAARPVPPLVPWTPIDVRDRRGQFPGVQLSETLPAFSAPTTLIVEVDVTNRSGYRVTQLGAVEMARVPTADATPPTPPSLDLVYYGLTNSIRSNTLELRIGDSYDAQSLIEQVRYRVRLGDDAGADDDWTVLSDTPVSAFQARRVYVPIDEADQRSTALVEIELTNGQGLVTRVAASHPLRATPDLTPPLDPALHVTYYGYYHASRANELDLLIDAGEDPESQIAQVAYRIVETTPDAGTSDEGTSSDAETVLVAWTEVPLGEDGGVPHPDPVSLSLPAFESSRTLRAEARITNGSGLSTTVSQPFEVLLDETPPLLTPPELLVDGLYDPAGPTLGITIGAVEEEASDLTQVAYRVATEEGEEIVEWTELESPEGRAYRAPVLRVPLSPATTDRELAVTVRATNAAGLEASTENTILIDVDETPPQAAPVTLRYIQHPYGTDYLYIETGVFRDPESGVRRIDYRIADAGGTTLVDWSVLREANDALRIDVAPQAVPRTRFPFAGAQPVVVEFRAVNGAGLPVTRQATLEIPGDTTPPSPPALQVTHRNAYEPVNANTIEIQIGASADPQSGIRQVRYRIQEATTGREIQDWVNVLEDDVAGFSGAIVFASLPFLNASTTLAVEVNVTNGAGLQNTVIEDVAVNVEGDATPPTASISLYYFDDEVSLVLEELTDPESMIQQVEYRFLDNVDQTVLSDWQDLIEITVPQPSYPKQAHSVDLPGAGADRTLKIELRVTNGAGLQSTVSKTVLFNRTEVGE